MEPKLRALYTVRPDYDIAAIDMVNCRDSLGRLLDFATGEADSKSFEMDVHTSETKASFSERNPAPPS